MQSSEDVKFLRKRTKSVYGILFSGVIVVTVGLLASFIPMLEELLYSETIVWIYAIGFGLILIGISVYLGDRPTLVLDEAWRITQPPAGESFSLNLEVLGIYFPSKWNKRVSELYEPTRGHELIFDSDHLKISIGLIASSWEQWPLEENGQFYFDLPYKQIKAVFAESPSDTESPSQIIVTYGDPSNKLVMVRRYLQGQERTFFTELRKRITSDVVVQERFY